jgi:hypothetical protein
MGLRIVSLTRGFEGEEQLWLVGRVGISSWIVFTMYQVTDDQCCMIAFLMKDELMLPFSPLSFFGMWFWMYSSFSCSSIGKYYVSLRPNHCF